MVKLIGISTGCFFKKDEPKDTNQILQALAVLSLDAVELNAILACELETLGLSIKNRKFLDACNYVALHMPANIYYDGSRSSQDLVARANMLVAQYRIQNAIIHPYRIEDWASVQDLPLSIENLHPNEGWGFDRIREALEIYPRLKLTLDVSHELAWSDANLERYLMFADRIVSVHVGFSRYGRGNLRDSTLLKQAESIKELEVPLILEEPLSLDNMDSVRDELDCLRQFYMT